MNSAGEFSAWLRLTRRAQTRTGESSGADVPCGDCTACCRSSLFIHIGPEEKETRKRIPKALMFPAPGLPKGHVLLGYDQEGRCPMLVDDRCSIYEHRPRTCRDYDCRVFPATGLTLEKGDQPRIAERIRSWKFDVPTQLDRDEHAAVQAAAVFLQNHRGFFPPGTLPEHPSQLAVVAIRVYEVFLQRNASLAATGTMPPDAEMAEAVMRMLDIER